MKNRDLLAFYKIMRGYAYYLPLGMLRESLENIEEGMKQFVNSGHSNITQIFSIYLVTVKQEIGLLEDNISILKEALINADSQAAVTAIPSIWIRIAMNSIFEEDVGQAREAIIQWEKTDSGTQVIAWKKDDIHVAKALIAFHTGDNEGFWHHAGEAIEAFEEKRDYFSFYQAACCLAHCYVVMGDIDHALSLLKKSLSLTRDVVNAYGEARCNLLIASIAYDQGRLNRAKGYLQKCLALCTDKRYDFLFLNKERKHAVKLLPFAIERKMQLPFVSRLLVILGEECVDPIILLLKHSDHVIRKTAITILSNMKYRESEKKLVELLKDPVPEVREQATVAISRLKELPPKPLKIYMLGVFRLFVGDKELSKSTWKRSKAKAIFKYLIFNNKDVPRDKLIDVFYRNNGVESGWKNVRQALCEIRKVLEPGIPDKAISSYLKVNNGFYRLILPEGSYVDCFEFEKIIQKASKEMRNECAKLS